MPRNTDINCIIISNRRIIESSGAESVSSDVAESRNVYYETENEYSEDSDEIRSSINIENFEEEDRICLSRFTPYE